MFLTEGPLTVRFAGFHTTFELLVDKLGSEN